MRQPLRIRPRPLDRGVPPGARRDRAARGAAVAGRSGDPVDAGREPDQVASRAHDLVLRDLSASAEYPRLQDFRRTLRLPVQFLLRRRRPAPRAAEARADHAAERRRGRRLSRACRCGGRAADRRGERRGAARDPAHPRDRAQSRGAASGADAHRHPARLRAEPDRARLRRELAAAARGAQDGYVDLPEGIHTIGHQGEGYCFDNEGPAHRVLVGPVRIARALVTNGEWLEFIARRRLRQPGAVALGRLGRGAERGLAGARPLAGPRRRMAAADARRACGRSIRPRRSCM